MPHKFSPIQAHFSLCTMAVYDFIRLSLPHSLSCTVLCSYDINQPIATRLHENTHMNQWTEHNAASISTANTIILGTIW